MKIGVIGLVLGMGIGGCVILMVGFVFLCFSSRKKRATEESADTNPMFDEFNDVELEMDQIPRKFLYSELARATRNFADREKVGEGGFDGVYRGFIEDLKSYVAVKRISIESSQGLKEYEAEVKIISRLRHRNLVQLIGWCHYEGQLLLVYKFIPNGSLDSHLYNGNSSLTWEVRYRIALALASALFYLHEESVRCVLHWNIKSSNVMLDSNFNAKLGDFGLARFVDHEKELQTTSLRGTMSYMAPEYVITGMASKRTEVYSFGIICLEIACGRKLIDLKSVNMVDWVWQLYEEKKVTEAADPKLCGNYDEKQMECLMIVGLWCAHPDYKMRPSIQRVIQVLNFEIPLPIFQSKTPVATNST
ncbi:L-type lectin-domain containing receptor kinase IX.1-like [Rosa rugosa]|uniref:L-type lectin-domain containing receptor kinase IX.1-like n=1 Tax=Rosa rugosa TaxID=74645 RepID=UPI002B40C13C|nr:L-type lectin-domain containing receptor kinase IX.1-like [Rosa rugosa]